MILTTPVSSAAVNSKMSVDFSESFISWCLVFLFWIKDRTLLTFWQILLLSWGYMRSLVIHVSSSSNRAKIQLSIQYQENEFVNIAHHIERKKKIFLWHKAPVSIVLLLLQMCSFDWIINLVKSNNFYNTHILTHLERIDLIGLDFSYQIE